MSAPNMRSPGAVCQRRVSTVMRSCQHRNPTTPVRSSSDGIERESWRTARTMKAVMLENLMCARRPP